MEFEKFDIEGPVLCKPKIKEDERGFFAEIFRKDLLEDFLNEKFNFCQSNLSISKKGYLGGIYFLISSIFNLIFSFIFFSSFLE